MRITDPHLPPHTRASDGVPYSLGLYVGLLPHRVSHLLTVVVLLLGLGQLLRRLLQLCLDAVQLLHGLRGGTRKLLEGRGSSVRDCGFLTLLVNDVNMDLILSVLIIN